MIAQPTRADRLLTAFVLFVCASLISLAMQPITSPAPAAAAPPPQIIVVTATPRPADLAGGGDPGPAPGPPEQAPVVAPAAAATAVPQPPAPAAEIQAAAPRAKHENPDGTYEYLDRPGWVYATGADGQEQLVRVTGIETVNGENFGAAANAQPADQAVIQAAPPAAAPPPRGGCAARHGRCH